MKKILLALCSVLLGAGYNFCNKFKNTFKKTNQGYAQAQPILGAMYSLGYGVKQDYKLAYAWENLAAAQGDENATKGKNIVANRLSAKQLGEAQNIAANIQYKIDHPTKA